MTVWTRRIAAPLLAVALCVLTMAARAESVSYYVEGVFTAGAGYTVWNMTTGVGDREGVSSVTNDTTGHKIEFSNDWITDQTAYPWSYDAASDLNTVDLFLDGTPSGARFGKFTLSGSGNASFDGVVFELLIYQVATDPPAPGADSGNPGTFTGSIKGTIYGGTLHFDDPLVTYLPDAMTGWPPGVRYDLTNDVVLSVTPFVQGTVSAAPLPGTAAAALPLLCGMGLLSRRRRIAIA